MLHLKKRLCATGTQAGSTTVVSWRKNQNQFATIHAKTHAWLPESSMRGRSDLKMQKKRTDHLVTCQIRAQLIDHGELLHGCRPCCENKLWNKHYLVGFRYDLQA